jgi:2-octaprenyl-6-methoxyphenol hydroxylase
VTNQTTDYDVVIVGGGMTGATLAIAIAQLAPMGCPWRVALIESHQIQPAHPSFDGRAIALAAGSIDALQQLGLWSAWQDFSHAIEHIHVVEQGHAGRVTLTADEFHVPALGAVLELSAAGYCLLKQIAKYDNISHFCPSKLTDISQSADFVSLTLSSGEQLTTRLLVGADGANSLLQTELNLPLSLHDFQQSAVITTLQSDEPVAARAWERFTSHGPLALLPLGEQTYSVVWCQSHEHAQQAMQLSEPEFTRGLQQAFGFRAGHFRHTGARAVYPLTLRYLPQTTHHRVVLVGNAAHQLHPVAGQGFNLAMRDIMALRDVLQAAVDPGVYSVLQSYRQQREVDQKRTIWFTSSLASLFAESALPLVFARQSGLLLMNHIPALKNALVQQALGYKS